MSLAYFSYQSCAVAQRLRYLWRLRIDANRHLCALGCTAPLQPLPLSSQPFLFCLKLLLLLAQAALLVQALLFLLHPLTLRLDLGLESSQSPGLHGTRL